LEKIDKEKKRKLCVFPNDPLEAYYKKGEIKENYFNPNNFFDEIHVFSPTENDIDPIKIKSTVGNAEIFIHTIGKLNLINFKFKLKNILKIVKKINPDIIRSYNPLMQGWLAIKVGEKMSLPVVISIHNNYDKDVRTFYKKNKKYLKYLKFLYSEKFIEKYVLSNATKIICAYRFLVPYAKRHGGRNIEVIYNRVNLSRFSPEIKPKFSFDKKAIIYVARLDPEKNHECIIKAITKLDVKLILIGNGVMLERLKSIVQELKLEEKVIFISSVSNSELGSYYNSADIFAAPIKQGGVSIPMLEAMACGLPLIISAREDNEIEDIDDAVLFTKNNPDDFKKAILKLINEPRLQEDLIQKGLAKIKMLDGLKMEEKEEEIYRNIQVSDQI
jgi:glycosyltransferase involved in cell wall biosynthesis